MFLNKHARVHLNHSLLAKDLQTTCVFWKAPKCPRSVGRMTTTWRWVDGEHTAGLIHLLVSCAWHRASVNWAINKCLLNKLIWYWCLSSLAISIILNNYIKTSLSVVNHVVSNTWVPVVCREHGTRCNKGIKNDKTLVSVLKMFGWQNDVWKAFYIMAVSVLHKVGAKY